MSRTFKDLASRAMKSASRIGVDPRNAHPVQSSRWERMWKDRERREAEREAKNEMFAAAWLSDREKKDEEFERWVMENPIIFVPDAYRHKG